MDNSVRDFDIVVSFGIILGNLVVSSSSVLADYAPFAVATSWLYAATLLCGFIIGQTLDDSSASFYGPALMALVAVSILGGVLVLTAVLSDLPFLDLVVLFAFQQTLPHFIFICVLGYAGVFGAYILRLFLGQL